MTTPNDEPEDLEPNYDNTAPEFDPNASTDELLGLLFKQTGEMHSSLLTEINRLRREFSQFGERMTAAENKLLAKMKVDAEIEDERWRQLREWQNRTDEALVKIAQGTRVLI